MRLQLGRAGNDGQWAAHLDAVQGSWGWRAAIGGGRGRRRGAGRAGRLLHGRRRGRILLGSELLAALLRRLLHKMSDLAQHALQRPSFVGLL